MSNSCLGDDYLQLFHPDENDSVPFLDHLERFSHVYSRAHSFLALLLCSFGVATNCINVIVLSKRRMLSSVNTVLTAIAFCDLGTMASYLVFVLRFSVFRAGPCQPQAHSYAWMLFIMLHMMVTVSLHSCSVWLAVMLALIRLLTVRSLKLHQASDTNVLWSNIHFYWALNILTFIVVFTFCIPTLLTYKIVENTESYYANHYALQCLIEPLRTTHNETSEMNVSTLMRTSPRTYTVRPNAARDCTMFRLQFWVNGVLFKVVPCLLLVVLLGCLLFTLSSARKSRMRLTNARGHRRHETDRATRMIIFILLIFLCTELPQGILAIMSGIYTRDPHFYRMNDLLADLVDMFSLVNSSVNFFLYCTMSSLYRRTFWQVVLPSSLYVRICAPSLVIPSILGPTSGCSTVALRNGLDRRNGGIELSTMETSLWLSRSPSKLSTAAATGPPLLDPPVPLARKWSTISFGRHSNRPLLSLGD